MLSNEFYDSSWFHYIVMPLLIFICKVSDVTLGTLRNLFLAKGIKSIVPVVGFFEVMIWIIAVNQVLKHLDNVMSYMGWGLGYAAGIYIGIKIDERLGLGLQMMRIVTNKSCDELVDGLAKENFGVTVMDGNGTKGPVKVIYIIIKRTDYRKVNLLVQQYSPEAFYTVEDIREANRGVFPAAGSNATLFYLKRLLPLSSRRRNI